MTEYIERKRAIEDACNALELYKSEYAELEDALNRIPAADVAEVTRCRECEFRSSWMMNRNLRYICPESGMFPNCENDFCSYGKRKGGADND